MSKFWETYLVIGVLGLGMVCGCSAERYAEKSDEVVDRSDQTEETAGSEESAEKISDFGAEAWCSDFGQSGLDEVVQKTWSDNVRLKAAWARLRRAEAAVDVARASLFPSVGANAEGSYSTRDLEGETGAGDSVGSDIAGQTYWELSATASYEVDIWGRHRHRAKAAELEARAAEAGARSVAMTVTSQVAEAWFDVIAQRRRVELLERQLEVSREILDITQDRLRRGLVPALDVATQRRNVESIRSELHLAESLLETSRHRLAVLVGDAPGSEEAYVETNELPEVTALPGAGVPADLLERRPDLRQAHLQLKAADERTAAAVADRLPRLQLSASLGFQSEQIAQLFEQIFASIGAGISQPIFEGGRLNAEVKRSEAAAQEQLYVYAETLLTALREVRDALTQEENQRERIESLERELDHAQSVVDLARKQYRTGSADYLRVLTGLEELQQIERTLLEARRQQISYRISLCRALGGTWVESVESSLDTQS